MDPAQFKAPYISQQDCWARADAFRAKYWPSDEIPVDILDIAELELELEIRPVPRLRFDADVDALLLGNWTTLLVDHQQYMEDRFLNRLKFIIAHELGHLVLHRDTFLEIPRESPEEWIAFMLGMPDEQYSFLEYHANEFAGRLLVPLEKLSHEFEGVLSFAQRNGLPRQTLDESHLQYLCNPLAKSFGVSQDVIERRLTREGLWPLRP